MHGHPILLGKPAQTPGTPRSSVVPLLPHHLLLAPQGWPSRGADSLTAADRQTDTDRPTFAGQQRRAEDTERLLSGCGLFTPNTLPCRGRC